MANTDRLTVLVADDSRVILKAFSRVMAEHYDLVEAADGQIAWEAIESNDEICAVFSDWEMPSLDGLELTKKIRASKNPRIRSLPIIMVTSKTDDESTKNLIYSAGATDFIAKPFDTTELLARAKSHVKRIDISGELETQQAVMNPSSRIGNANYFQQQGEQMISFANRHNLPMAVVLVGIDSLTAHGVNTGANEKQLDEFILTIGAHIGSVMRKDDSVARLGKGVFGVLLSSADLKLAGGFARRLQATINKQNISLNSKDVRISLSIGMEFSGPCRKRQLKGMLKTARERLVVASRDGNTIRPRPQTSKQRVKLDSLDKALSLVSNKRAEDIDMGYLMKRIFPLLVHFDKTHDTEIAKAALPIVKGEKKQK